jgi:hypothetical protein
MPINEDHVAGHHHRRQLLAHFPSSLALVERGDSFVVFPGKNTTPALGCESSSADTGVYARAERRRVVPIRPQFFEEPRNRRRPRARASEPAHSA